MGGRGGGEANVQGEPRGEARQAGRGETSGMEVSLLGPWGSAHSLQRLDAVERREQLVHHAVGHARTLQQVRVLEQRSMRARMDARTMC